MSEQVFTVNISAAKRTDRPKRARKAVTLLKNFIEKQTGAIPLIGQNLNKEIWKLGGKKIPTKVKIAINVDDGYAKTELFGHEFNEKTKDEILEERKAKEKKPSKKEKTKEEHKTPEKKDGTEKIPKEVKESHVADLKEQSKEAEASAKDAKEVKKESHQRKGLQDNESKS